MDTKKLNAREWAVFIAQGYLHVPLRETVQDVAFQGLLLYGQKPWDECSHGDRRTSGPSRVEKFLTVHDKKYKNKVFYLMNIWQPFFC